MVTVMRLQPELCYRCRAFAGAIRAIACWLVADQRYGTCARVQWSLGIRVGKELGRVGQERPVRRQVTGGPVAPGFNGGRLPHPPERIDNLPYATPPDPGRSGAAAPAWQTWHVLIVRIDLLLEAGAPWKAGHRHRASPALVIDAHRRGLVQLGDIRVPCPYPQNSLAHGATAGRYPQAFADWLR